jgi:uncharacterized protein YcbK (DUF882 family)
MNRAFMDRLDAIRTRVGRPVWLTSAKRCFKHNLAVSTVGESSPHLLGIAADIAVYSSHERWEIVTAAVIAGINRIGVGAKFVHVDSGGVAPYVPNMIWLY